MKRPIPRRIISHSRLAAATLADQGISSASNFLVGAAVARVAGASGLGGFAVAYAAFQFVSAMHRALIADPMAIDGDARDEDWRPRIRSGLAAELLLGSVSTVLFACIGIAFFAAHRPIFGVAFAVMSPFLIFLLVQDYWRRVAFMRRRPTQALLNDIAFTCIQVAALVVVFLVHRHTAAAIILGWGLGALGGALLGLLQFRVRPRARGGWTLLRSRWSFSKWIAINSAVVNGLAQASVVATGAILGLRGLGDFKAAQALIVGPIGVLIQAGGGIGLPEASRAFASSGWPGLLRVCRLISAAGFVSVVACIAIVMVWGRLLLRLIYGSSFENVQMVAVLIGCSFLFVALEHGPILALKSTRNTQPLFMIQAAYSVISLIAIVILSIAYGIYGTAVATILASAANAIGLTWFQHRLQPSGTSRRKQSRAVLRSGIP